MQFELNRSRPVQVPGFRLMVKSIVNNAKKAPVSGDNFYQKKALLQLDELENYFHGLFPKLYGIIESDYIPLSQIKDLLPNLRLLVESTQNYPKYDSLEGIANVILGWYAVSEGKQELAKALPYHDNFYPKIFKFPSIMPMASNDNQTK